MATYGFCRGSSCLESDRQVGVSLFLPFSSNSTGASRSWQSHQRSSTLACALHPKLLFRHPASISPAYAWNEASSAIRYLSSLSASVWTGLLKLPPTSSYTVKGSSLRFPAPCCSFPTNILASGKASGSDLIYRWLSLPATDADCGLKQDQQPAFPIGSFFSSMLFLALHLGLNSKQPGALLAGF